MRATGPNGFTSHTSLMLMARSMRRRHEGLETMIFAIWRPAMLNDFEGELRMTLFFLHASLTAAKGWNVCPGIISSQCISSLTTFTLCFRQISFIRSNSSFVHTRPVGLWGLQSRNTVVFSSEHFASKSSQSIEKVGGTVVRRCGGTRLLSASKLFSSPRAPVPSCPRIKLVSSTSQPLLRTEEKKQL